ncbi:MAG: adenosine deaminase [Halobacteriovoraceae bacterium]|nr:adenosine deaminase [Halobacteriovoraceae bacterium]|tara:strand:- start:8791 stop:10026 length:1236 start_codon:yes stop_codon:yes gene_type:complete
MTQKIQYNEKFIREMPKSDLHLHLDGSLRLKTLIEMAKKDGVELPSYTPEGLQKEVFKPTYNNLGEYLRGFQYTCNVLRNLENIERASYELAIDNQKEGVNYIEVRFAPQLLVDLDKNLDFESILTAAYKGLERAKKEYNNGTEVKDKGKPEFHYGIISCAMRMFGPKGFSPYYSNLYQMMSFSRPGQIIRFAAMEMVRACVKLRDEKGLPIVGIDLAGQEEGYPAGKFSEAYAYAHKNFMHKTVHAGEAYGAESIFEAITECYADRIGHGYSLFMPERIKDPNIQDKEDYIKNLASFIADKRTVIEVCLTSNMQTNPELSKITEHKFKNMLDNRMATTICTDNRLVSNTTVTKEYQLALDNFDIPLKRLKDIVAYGFKKSFFPGSYVEKRAYAKLNMQYFDKIVEENLNQ